MGCLFSILVPTEESYPFVNHPKEHSLARFKTAVFL